MVSFLKAKIITVLFYAFRIFPIQRNKIVFSNFAGKGYGDNAKYIAQELLRRENNKYDLVWLYDGEEGIFPEGIRTVRRLSLKAIYEQVTAKIWVDNRRKPIYVRKRKNQYYIQTWHAMSVMKKVEKDAERVLSKRYIKAAKNDSEMADLFLAASRFDVELYRNSFWYTGEILECGYPRHDILFNDYSARKEEVKIALGIDSMTRIVMYAPTFRHREDGSELELYDIGWNGLLEALHKRFGGDWVGMERLHPNISRFSSKLNIPEGVIDVTNYPDMQELLVISDCVISDYSSSLIEFAMTGKMGFIFAVDILEYDSDRGLYFGFDTLPFSVADSREKLIDSVLSFDEDEYKKRNKEFYHDKLGLLQGGHAAMEVADRIEKEINQY